jgi:hypothetical protein
MAEIIHSSVVLELRLFGLIIAELYVVSSKVKANFFMRQILKCLSFEMILILRNYEQTCTSFSALKFKELPSVL